MGSLNRIVFCPTDKEARDFEQSKDDCSILIGLKIRFL